MKRITARFYMTEAGNEPVRTWLLGLDPTDRKIVGTDIATVEFGWPIGMPTCGPIGAGLFEVRSTIEKGKVETRVYFEIIGSVMLLLASHSGKNEQAQNIALARSRLKEHKSREAQIRKENEAKLKKSKSK